MTIEDENDNAPVFEEDKYSFYVRYDASVGTYIGRIKAVDPDAGKW